MLIGRFYAGIAAVIRSPATKRYLLLHRSVKKDFAPGVWECVTGRVNQGEGFEEALRREVREELNVEVQVEYILGTTHFYRGASIPENELIGVIYLCSLAESASIRIGPEHSEYRWLSAIQAITLLSNIDPSTQWAKRVIQHADAIHSMIPDDLVRIQSKTGFEFG
jgi:8-oxo-dGTP diphosphatase